MSELHVLVTGGAGYIGSVLVPQLLDDGHRVTVVDRFYFGAESLAAPAREHGERLQLWRRDVRSLATDDFAGIDAVIDLAGISNDPACELNPRLTRDINFSAAVEVARAARQAGVRRFVFASSCSVYGHGDSTELREDSPTHPVSLYAECKLDAERVLLPMSEPDAMCVTALRFATVFGRAPRMRFDLAVNVMTRCAYVDRVVRVEGGGKQWRPFVHVADVARAVRAVLDSPVDKVSGRVFNVGTDANNLQIRALAFRIRDCIPGTEIEVVPSDPDIRNYNVCFDRIRDELGFVPERSIEDGIDEVRRALASGELDPDDRRWYTLRNYLFLAEVEEVYRNVALAGQVLSAPGLMRPADDAPRIDFYRHGVGQRELGSVARTFDSLFLTCGPRVAELEGRLAAILGCEHVVGVSSCTMGLMLVLRAFDIGPGDEVITTPMTFAATSNAILMTGADVVFADIDPRTGLIDPVAVEAAITERTRAVIPVHLYGQLAPMRRLSELARRHDLRLIEDGAHGVESRRGEVQPGTLGDAAVFSFYATKTLTSGDGGAIAVHDEAVAARLRRLRNHGMTRDAAQRHGQVYQHWDMDELGYKAALTDIEAAVVLPQLPGLEARRAARQALVERYEARLADHPDVTLVERTGTSSHHLCAVLVPAARRDAVLARLGQQGIGCAVNYRAVHTLRYYARTLGLQPDACPHAADFGARTISLPLYPGMPAAHVDRVCAALSEALART